MPIQAQNLPPGKSVLDFPIVTPGQEMSEEQKDRATIAKLAGIAMAGSAAKQRLTDATTMQVVALLRAADLTTQAGVEAFASSAAAVVRMAISQAKNISWSGVRLRAAEMGVSLPSMPPLDDELPREVRYTRGSTLEDAYARIARDYQDNLLKTRNDKQIKDLIREMESQGMTTIPRIEDITGDAVERTLNGEEEWVKAFRKIDEEGKSREDARRETSAEARQERAKTEAGRRAAEPTRSDRAERAAERTRQRIEQYENDKAERDILNAEQREAELLERDEQRAEYRLSDAEVAELVERWAEQKAEEAAEKNVNHDVQAQSRNTHNAAMQKLPKDKVYGYRRVIHPELNKSGQSCGLCIVASTMLYTKKDLLPIHTLCKCETVEVYKSNGKVYDAGNQINMEDLDVFYREAGRDKGPTTHGWDLKRQKYEIVDHPEYGPTLVNVGKYSSGEKVQYTSRKGN